MAGEEQIQRIERGVQQVLREVEALPPEVLYRDPQAGEWAVMSILAHMVELLPYWAHQAAQVARNPGKPFGRTMEDPDRIAAVEHHGHDSLEATVPRLRASLDECVRTLRALPPQAWTAAGEHSRRGSMTVEQLVDDFLVRHVEDHLAQTRATLQALKTA